jgi:hypothetical protein
MPETPYLPVVIAGLDPVIPLDSGGCRGARIKSGHDEERMDGLPLPTPYPDAYGACAGHP